MRGRLAQVCLYHGGRTALPGDARPGLTESPNREEASTNVGVLDKLMHIGEGRKIRQLEKIADQVNFLEPEFEAMSDEELGGQTAHLRAHLADGQTLDDLLPDQI